ncbi:MAG: hypothetical protein K0Q72_2120 [Armatimonadetes bacterium]|jgi:hypothetical protein|nr:hypothetical protein [Armatimonadota bacterium]
MFKFQYLGAALLALAVGGCTSSISGDSGASGTTRPAVPVISGPRATVEDYLKAATSADGARMYALIASSERDDESPQTLRKTAADRYSTATKWEVLKTTDNGSTGEVIVEVKGAKVDPNPTRFTLTRESGEWRIVDSPELHEREKDGGIHIKL